jgi:hypothetical protein
MKKTVKELYETKLRNRSVDVITVHYADGTDKQYDKFDSFSEIADKQIDDYEFEFDADDCMVYLDIYMSEEAKI